MRQFGLLREAPQLVVKCVGGIPFFGWHGELGVINSLALVSLSGNHAIEIHLDSRGYALRPSKIDEFSWAHSKKWPDCKSRPD